MHAFEAQLARAHTRKKLKFTPPGPMTIVDTVADRFYGDKVKMAFAFAELLNQLSRCRPTVLTSFNLTNPPYHMKDAADWV